MEDMLEQNDILPSWESSTHEKLSLLVSSLIPIFIAHFYLECMLEMK